MANTEQIEAKLCAYVDGDLDAAARAEIEQHLAANPQHRQLLAELMEQRNLLRELPREKAPDDLFDSMQTQLERSVLLDANRPSVSGPRNRWSQVMALAAIFVLAIGLGAVIFFVLPEKGKQHRDYAIIPPTTGPTAFEMSGRTISDTPATLPAAPGAAPMDSLAKAVPEPLRSVGKFSDAVAIAPPSIAPPSNAPTTQSAVALGAAASEDIFSKNGASDRKADVNGSNARAPIDAEIADRVRQSTQVPADSMVVVVDTANPTATDQQVTGYLAMNNIRWDEMPAPVSQAIAGGGDNASQSAAPAMRMQLHESVDAVADAVKKQESQKSSATNGDLDQTKLQTAQSNVSKDAVAVQQSAVAKTTPAAQPGQNSVATDVSQPVNADKAVAQRQQLQTQQPLQSQLSQSRYIVARGLTQSQVAELNTCIAAQNTGSIANYRRNGGAITPTTLPVALAIQQKPATTQPAGAITFEGGIVNDAVSAGAASGFGGGRGERNRATSNPTTTATGQIAGAWATTAPASGHAMTATTAPTPTPTLVPTTQAVLTPRDIAAAAIAAPPSTSPSLDVPTSQAVAVVTSRRLAAESASAAPTTAPTTAPTSQALALDDERVDVVIVVKSTALDQSATVPTAAPAPAAVVAAPAPTSAPVPAATQPVIPPPPVLKARRP